MVPFSYELSETQMYAEMLEQDKDKDLLSRLISMRDAALWLPEFTEAKIRTILGPEKYKYANQLTDLSRILPTRDYILNTCNDLIQMLEKGEN